MNTMNRTSISRRQFLGAAGATVAGFGATTLFGAQPAKANLYLGMMLQGGSADELQQKATAIAAAGFETVQLTFFPKPAS